MNEARPAVQLAWPYQLVNSALLGDPVEVRRRMAKRGATEIATEIGPSRVVAHQHDDVGPLLLRLRRADERGYGS